MKPFKEGDTIFLGAGKAPQLYATVIQVHKNGSCDFDVINGDWRGTYNPTARTVHVHQKDSSTPEVDVLYRGWTPPGDRHAKLVYVTEYLSSSWRFRVMWTIQRVYQSVRYWSKKIWIACHNSVRIFIMTMKSPMPSHYLKEMELDDDIPF